MANKVIVMEWKERRNHRRDEFVQIRLFGIN